MRVQLDARKTFFSDLVLRRLRLRFMLLLCHALLLRALLSSAILIFVSSHGEGSRATSCSSTPTSFFSSVGCKLLAQRQGVLESLMLPLGIIEVVFVLLHMACEVFSILLAIGFVLADMPVCVVELVHRNDAQVIAPE